jgi:16S rRNA (adenine1518-N6/adenine1519-N6)-dimethyltransferase
LLDLNITRKIVRLSGDLSQNTILEIGPGPGGLTRAIFLEGATNLIAIEKDPRAVTALQDIKIIAQDNFTIQQADALKLNLRELSDKPLKIIANLPYNISTKLLTNWLHDLPMVQSMTLMFQKEVADRILASPNTKAYGRLSIIAQSLCKIKKLFDLPKEAFSPPPKITSTVLYFQPLQPFWSEDKIQALEKITMTSFGKRRKMLRSNLREIGLDKIYQETGLPLTLRAENLTIANYQMLLKGYLSMERPA